MLGGVILVNELSSLYSPLWINNDATLLLINATLLDISPSFYLQPRQV